MMETEILVRATVKHPPALKWTQLRDATRVTLEGLSLVTPDMQGAGDMEVTEVAQAGKGRK